MAELYMPPQKVMMDLYGKLWWLDLFFHHSLTLRAAVSLHFSFSFEQPHIKQRFIEPSYFGDLWHRYDGSLSENISP